MKRIQEALIGLGALLGAVPGIALLGKQLPITAELRPLFAITLEVVAGLTLLVCLLRRRALAQRSQNEAVKAVVISGSVAVLALWVYFGVASSTIRVVESSNTVPDTVVVPMAPHIWGDGRLDTMVACVERDGILASPTCATATPRWYTATDVEYAIRFYGRRAVEPHIGGWGKAFTAIVLLLALGMASMFIVVGFVGGAISLVSLDDAV